MSFKRLIIRASIFGTIPLIVLIIINNIYSINIFNQKISESNQRTIDFIALNVEKELEKIESAFTTQVASNDEFARLSGQLSTVQSHVYSQDLLNELKVAMASCEYLDAVFVSSNRNLAYRDYFVEGYSYSLKIDIQNFVVDCSTNDLVSYSDNWICKNFDGSNYLFHFFGGRSNYIVAMVNVDKLINEINVDDSAMLILSNVYSGALNDGDYIKNNEIVLDSLATESYVSGYANNFMIVPKTVLNKQYMLTLIVQRNEYFGYLNFVQFILVLLSLLAIFAVPAYLMWIQHVVIKPVDKFKAVMDSIKYGNLAHRASYYSDIKEFREMSDNFNNMMNEIKNLKIEAYEKEIENEKSKLRYLQLQIKPHFFLNCLKSIYALAEKNDYEKIQKMILSFSKHIRYIFGDSTDFVTVAREVEHIKNYVEIQKISAKHEPVCIINVDERLLNMQIPPLSIHTFVENSVKHEWHPDKSLEIKVDAKIIKSEEGFYADFIVSDNGEGYTEEVLKEINEVSETIYKGNHVGLSNVKNRLKLTYGDGVVFAFFNDKNGSVSEIIIPIGDEFDECNGS